MGIFSSDFLKIAALTCINQSALPGRCGKLLPKLATDSLSQIRLFRQKNTGFSWFGSQYLN